MKIHNIKITNFKSLYGEHYFNFDELEGLVKLSGPIGAGKTSLGEALCVGLFGKVKDHTNPNLVAWGTDTFEIELNLTSKGHNINIIRNPKKQLSVYIDGKLLSAPGKNDMQAALEKFYDVPRMAIEKMCVISFNAFNSLAAMNPHETKVFLDDIFGFKTFTDYNDEVVLERKEQQTRLAELNAVLEDTTKQIDNLENKKMIRQQELSNSIDIDALNTERSDYINNGIEKKVELDNIKNELNNKLSSYNNDIKLLESKKTEAATLGKVQKNNYNKFKNGTCPTCGHEINTSTIDSYKQKMECYAADWKHYDEDIKKISNKKREIEIEYNDNINKIQQDINTIKTKISNIDNNIKSYKNSLKLINENYDDLILSCKDKQEMLNKEITECHNEIKDWNEMNDLFTKTLRYRLLDTLIPHINNSIQYFIDKFEQGYKIQFDQEFKAHIFTDNIEGEISYKDLSTGQRKTLDLAIIFGILQNIIANVDFNIMFLDELMSNLDSDSRNTMISVMNKTIAKDRSIFIINHAEMGDDFFNHKIRVRLKNKPIKMSKKKLRNTVDTGSDEIIGHASTYEIIHF